jgi:hypothetical protein
MCLLLNTNNIIENIYCEYSVIIWVFLNISLQDSLGLVFVMILIIFFCNLKTLLALGELP